MAEKWTVKGRIVVDHLLPELAEAFGEREGVPEGRARWAERRWSRPMLTLWPDHGQFPP